MTGTENSADPEDVLGTDPVEGAALICSAMASTFAMALVDDPDALQISVLHDAMMSVWDALDVDYRGPQWKLAFGLQCQTIIAGKMIDQLCAWASACSILRQPGISILAAGSP